MNDDLQQALQQARQHFDAGACDAAAALCRDLMRRFPGAVEPCLAMAEVERARARPRALLEALREASARAPDSLELHRMLGDACMAQEDFEGAAASYRTLRRMQPHNGDWVARLAIALQQCGHLDEAIILHREVLAGTPDSPQAHFNLGTALKRRHDFAGAEHCYRRAVALAPDSPPLRMSLASLLVETSRFEEAVTELQWILARVPGAADPLHLLSYAFKKLSRGDASMAAAQRLVDLTGASLESLVALSAAQLTAAAYVDALATSERGLAMEPANRNLLSDRAIALSALGDAAAARALFDTQHLIRIEDLQAPAGFGGVEAFNAALVHHVASHPTLDFSGLSLSCHEGATSDEVFVPPLGPLQDLMDAIRAAAGRYQRALPAVMPGNTWTGALPDIADMALSGWVTRLRSQGYQHGHIHPTAWLSGVYYVSLPPEVSDRGDAGWIEFGRAPYFYADADQGDIVPVQPRPGRLVLFPSYFYHRTIAFQSEHERLTIAFDFRLDA
jgi:Flp pilus assembly protein TadD